MTGNKMLNRNKAHITAERNTAVLSVTMAVMNDDICEACSGTVDTGEGGRAKRRITAFACLLTTVGLLSPSLAAEQMPEGVFIDAKDLTSNEMFEVRRISREAGKDPWLIFGFRYGRGPESAPRRSEISIYLQPDVANAHLRRGRLLEVEMFATPSAQPASGRIRFTRKYAQVIVLSGRPPEVTGRLDAHRPFVVDGEFDDQTLLRIVALIRRSPPGPPLPNGQPSGTNVNGSLQISSIRRVDTKIEVMLNLDDDRGQYVTLENRNGEFVIVRLSHWIA